MDESSMLVLPEAEKAPWAVPALYGLAPFRNDAALAAAVDDRLMPWIEQVGIFPGRHDKVRAMAFGRFAMLCHTDTDEPDRLLLAAQCFAALFAVDDYYCDDERTGSEPSMVGPRLSLALAALEPVHLGERFRPGLEQALNSDPVLVACVPGWRGSRHSRQRRRLPAYAMKSLPCSSP